MCTCKVQRVAGMLNVNPCMWYIWVFSCCGLFPARQPLHDWTSSLFSCDVIDENLWRCLSHTHTHFVLWHCKCLSPLKVTVPNITSHSPSYSMDQSAIHTVAAPYSLICSLLCHVTKGTVRLRLCLAVSRDAVRYSPHWLTHIQTQSPKHLLFSLTHSCIWWISVFIVHWPTHSVVSSLFHSHNTVCLRGLKPVLQMWIKQERFHMDLTVICDCCHVCVLIFFFFLQVHIICIQSFAQTQSVTYSFIYGWVFPSRSCL